MKVIDGHSFQQTKGVSLHSKADEKFIRRLYADLKKCQIEPWLDSEDIRHGKPWLDAIFEEGIPTCDCVIVYFSETSLDSAMVRKRLT